MKSKILTRCVVFALFAGTMSFCCFPAEAVVQVNPIKGMSADFIKGADISMLPQMENDGAKFYDTDGKEMDCMKIMQNHGVNWIRLRIWNHPTQGAGNTDEAKALAMAKRAHALGLKVLIDFHYSDWWADPGKQTKPKAWEGHSKEQLVTDVYDFTSKVIKDLQAQGTEPDMVQIGNEIKNGMIWPEGKLPADDGGKELAKMVQAGLQAVHDSDADHTIKTMIHLPDGGDNAFYQSWFNQLILDNKVNDFDIIGLSYYPFWHGSLTQLSANMDDISKRYNKDVIVVETAVGFSNENFDATPNLYGPEQEKLSGFRSTVQGQATGLREIMQRVVNVPDYHGKGIFYWAPESYAPAGIKVDDAWDNLCMFGPNGRALDSMDVFKDVSDLKLPTVIARAKSAESGKVIAGVGKPVKLPETVRVTYTDDHTQDDPVIWDNPAVIFNKEGTYHVKGKLKTDSMRVDCEVDVRNNLNLVRNPDFEDGTLNGWTINGDRIAVSVVSKTGDALGKSALHYWSNGEFRFQVEQSFTDLPDGKYTVKAMTQGGGGEKRLQLYVIGDNGQKQTADIKNVGWNNWQTGVIKDVEIKNGQAKIGMGVDAKADTWGSIDNFEFFKQK